MVSLNRIRSSSGPCSPSYLNSSMFRLCPKLPSLQVRVARFDQVNGPWRSIRDSIACLCMAYDPSVWCLASCLGARYELRRPTCCYHVGVAREWLANSTAGWLLLSACLAEFYHRTARVRRQRQQTATENDRIAEQCQWRRSVLDTDDPNTGTAPT